MNADRFEAVRPPVPRARSDNERWLGTKTEQCAFEIRCAAGNCTTADYRPRKTLFNRLSCSHSSQITEGRPTDTLHPPQIGGTQRQSASSARSVERFDLDASRRRNPKENSADVTPEDDLPSLYSGVLLRRSFVFAGCDACSSRPSLA